MSKISIKTEKLETITFDEKTNELTLNWYTGGNENVVCGLVLKVELVKKIISGYKHHPDIVYDPNYNEAF